MTRFLPVTLFSILTMFSAASAQEAQSVSEMVGFKFIKETSQYKQYTFRNEGIFLISKKGFDSRNAAIEFCKSQQGYQLSSLMLVGVMTMSGLHFPELRKANLLNDKVLTGAGTLGGETRSGIVFWIAGQNQREESILSQKPDVVFEFRDGCGDCDWAEPLSDINARLEKIKKPKISPLAVCADSALEKHLNEN